MVALMCLCVLSNCRYIGSLSKQHSRYLRHLGRVFVLCRSFFLDLNHSDQRNSFCPQKVKYSCLQIQVLLCYPRNWVFLLQDLQRKSTSINLLSFWYILSLNPYRLFILDGWEDLCRMTWLRKLGMLWLQSQLSLTKLVSIFLFLD